MNCHHRHHQRNHQQQHHHHLFQVFSLLSSYYSLSNSIRQYCVLFKRDQWKIVIFSLIWLTFAPNPKGICFCQEIDLSLPSFLAPVLENLYQGWTPDDKKKWMGFKTKHCQTHGIDSFNTFSSTSFEILVKLHLVFCLALGDKYREQLWQIHVTT